MKPIKHKARKKLNYSLQMNLNWKTDFPHIVYKEYFFQKSFVW